jgi:uncharacterized protein (TIGR00645 family)
MARTDAPIVPADNGRILASLIPHAHLVTIDDGPLFLVANARRTMAMVSEFLSLGRSDEMMRRSALVRQRRACRDPDPGSARGGGMSRIKRAVEALVVGCRWLVAPFLIGLMIGLAALLFKFVLKLVDFLVHLPGALPADVIVGILNLVDLALTANLIVIVIASSYENFVAPIESDRYPDWPEGLVRIGFAGLKQKLLGSIVAIAAVNVLEWFMDIEQHADNTKLAWVVGILMAFAVAMLILAIADRVSSAGEGGGH